MRPEKGDGIVNIADAAEGPMGGALPESLRVSDDFGRSTFDPHRMRRERHQRLVSSMVAHGLDALILTYPPNVTYATGFVGTAADPSYCHMVPAVAVVTADGALPHLFAPRGIPQLEASHHHAISIETEGGAAVLAGAVRDIVGRPGVIGIDEMAGALIGTLPDILEVEALADPSTAIAGARIIKTADEVECIYRAQFLNELAMYDVQAELRPGLRECDLTALFLDRICRLGAASVLDPIWQVTPRHQAGGPRSSNGELPFPTPPSDRILRRGDVLLVDTGIAYEGYASDFGRTWIVGESSVSGRDHGYFEAWREVVSRVLDVLRPGVTGAELTAAASLDGKAKPWLAHFYLAHGIGLESAEMPLVGTDLGPDFDASIVLAPGMMLVLEPVIWDDGYGGYRGEEIVVVTTDGHEVLSRYPYDPFDEGGVARW
jgi:Xaa-Pro dipeptidase